MIGRIVKAIAGFYYVDGDGKIIECKARGVFRNNKISPLVGDMADIEIDNGKGVINSILKRKNEFIRPAVSNISQVFLVFSYRSPDINEDLLNKYLLLCEEKQVNTLVIFNKSDLASDINTKITDMVKSAGYEYISINAKGEDNLYTLKERLKDNITMLSGPSGVGKSTLLNKLLGREKMETGEISEKIKRGKNTTRHCELISINGGLMADTPGFSSINTDFITKENIKDLFPEFREYNGRCRFTSCSHNKEIGCLVKEAVDNGKINKLRYEFYIKELDEINSRREWK
ncbi:MAG: ribosome small subunit-dependent GTPase A [Bacillota bacterium]|nr:ribosome small subunit-dependent GTPase A [Bacillota bacterium]